MNDRICPECGGKLKQRGGKRLRAASTHIVCRYFRCECGYRDKAFVEVRETVLSVQIVATATSASPQ